MFIDTRDLPETAEPVEYRGGGHTTIGYRVPVAEAGPVIRGHRDGLVARQVLVYMLGHFVFTWRAGDATVSIEHGDIDGRDNMPLPWTFAIRDDWTYASLAREARKWRAEHLRKCMAKRGGAR